MNHELHASAFAYKGIGCLLLGESGTGKSTTVAQAVMLGAILIADDHLFLHNNNGILMAEAPQELSGVLELHSLGLIKLPNSLRHHPLHLAVELTHTPTERLPNPHTIDFLGVHLPLLKLPAAPQTPVASLLLYLQAMQEHRILPQDWRPSKL